MDDVQILPSGSYQEEKGSGLKIILIIFGLIIASLAVAGSSYFLGTKFSNIDPAVTTGLPPTRTPQPTDPTKTPSATPTHSNKPTPATRVSPSPTAKMSPTPTLIVKTKILPSVPILDGFRSSNGGGNNSLEVRAGRNSELVTRGFVSFDIVNMPSAAKIQSAAIRLYLGKVTGKPFSAGGNLMIDHLTYGDALDESDYASPALSANFASFESSTVIGWKEADVTARFKDDLANARSLSQFRIHFQNEITGGDTAGDFVYFEAQENTLKTGNAPQLVVKYY